ncbi:MAG: serine hydrolase domain-containing protein [Steroidobacteraceae bacterium]
MSRLLLILLLLCAYRECAAGPPTIPKATLDDVRAMVETAPGELGLVVAVTDRDNTLLTATHGYADITRRRPATRDTRFAIGSISKSFTAIALMQMADEGRFDPEAPIAKYLPAFRPRSKFPPITGRALLSHTSGLPNYLAQVASMRFLIAALGDFEPPYAPGEHFWYSNSGYQLLGYAAEAIDGQPFPLIVQQRVLDRLGMQATAPQIDDRLRGRIATSYVRSADGRYVEAPWFDYLSADGAIVSNATDMGLYARMLLARGDTPRGRLISASAFDRFATAGLEDYGYGIEVREGGRILAHSGSIAGFQAWLFANLEEGFAVVFLCNGPLDAGLRERVVMQLSKAKDPVVPVAPTPWPGAASFEGGFIGSGASKLGFRADKPDGLALVDGEQAVPLTRLGKETWGLYLSPQGPRAFFFFRDAAGMVSDVSEGATSYRRRGVDLPPVEEDPAFDALVGRYAAHGEEGPDLRVFVRGGQLMMAYVDADFATALVGDGPARFRFARPAHAPERLAFDTVLGGRAQRLVFSGVPLYRIDLP